MQTVLIFLLMALLEIETKSIIALGKTNEIAEQIPTVIGQSPEYNNDDQMLTNIGQSPEYNNDDQMLTNIGQSPEYNNDDQMLTNIGQKHAGNTPTKGMSLLNVSLLKVYTQLKTADMTLILLYSLKL